MTNQRKLNYLLSGFRGFSFALAVAQTVIYSSPVTTAYSSALLIGVGAYTVVKILVPFRWYQRHILSAIVLVVDAFVCAFLPFFTGGLSSPFLIYSLNSILTIALFAERRIALGAAVLISSFVVGIQVFSSQLNWLVSPDFNSPDEYLGILLMYVFICFFTAILPFITNVNIKRKIAEKATVDERNRLVREMHDGLAQDMAYLEMKMTMLRNSLSPQSIPAALTGLDEMKLVVSNMNSDLREMMGLLRLKAIDGVGLMAVLVNHVHEFSQRTGIKSEMFVADGQMKLSSLAELHMLRLVQEVLVNIRKHANATKLQVRIEDAGKWVCVSIRDNGMGFEPASYMNRQDKGEHVGLKIMRERLEELGGDLTVISKPGQGTEVLFRIPIIS